MSTGGMRRRRNCRSGVHYGRGAPKIYKAFILLEKLYPATLPPQSSHRGVAHLDAVMNQQPLSHVDVFWRTFSASLRER